MWNELNLHTDADNIEVRERDILDGLGERNASAHLACGYRHDESSEGLGSQQ